MRRRFRLIAMPPSNSSLAVSGVTRIRSRRSPPAKNVFFAEVTTTPRMVSFSASRRSVTAASESRNAWLTAFADWFGSSMTRVTRPVRSCSQRMVVDSVLMWRCSV
ncbi:hypothetical protein SVIOM74S_10540 [Streptomyces violarus]